VSKERGDLDLDFFDRNKALENLLHIPASIITNNKITKHNTGVYFHAVPIDPVTEYCSLDYEVAEKRGMYKMDFLNVSIYKDVKNEEHLINLMEKPIDWNIFCNKEFVSKLFHIGNYSELVSKLKPKSIEDIAIILALIRPGKKYLQETCLKNGFNSIKDLIWRQEGDGYVYKKSHAISYAVLVYVHSNLLLEQQVPII
jgi:DNA polymerase III alpha subunit